MFFVGNIRDGRGVFGKGAVDAAVKKQQTQRSAPKRKKDNAYIQCQKRLFSPLRPPVLFYHLDLLSADKTLL
jgi:putative methionine-R-sulfoxide reductase with GAF domain